MSGQTWRTRGAARGKVTHPDESILLAYVRRQLPDRSWSDIDLHLTHCAACSQRKTELEESSTTLIAGLRPSSEKPEKEENWDWLENPEEARLFYQRRQKERLHEDLSLGFALLTHLPQVFLALVTRLSQVFMALFIDLQQAFVKVIPSLAHVVRYQKAPSYPTRIRAKNSIQAASVLLVFALVLVLAVLLALAAGKNPFFLFHATNNYAPTTGQSKLIVPAQPTATANGTIPGAGGIATATPAGSKPTISLCLAPTDKIHSRIRICGVNFTPGDKVELVIKTANSPPKTLRPVAVDTFGKFQDVWNMNACKNGWIVISAQDVEHPAIVSQVLLNNQYGGCTSNPKPLPTVVAGHH